MIIYHGSTTLVEKPEIRTGVTMLDFGIGFYTTTSYEQAERWARIKLRREKKQVAYVAIYDFDYETAQQEAVIQKFDCADMAWLEFVVGCRRGAQPAKGIDMHIGPVADDTVYQSIRFFETVVLDAEETTKRLKTEALHDQWVFHTEKILSYCKFLGHREVR